MLSLNSINPHGRSQVSLIAESGEKTPYKVVEMKPLSSAYLEISGTLRKPGLQAQNPRLQWKSLVDRMEWNIEVRK